MKPRNVSKELSSLHVKSFLDGFSKNFKISLSFLLINNDTVFQLQIQILILYLSLIHDPFLRHMYISYK